MPIRQHIDTAPIWESYRQDCECPLCLLRARVEAANVEYFLGESVMEPDQRIEVNRKGFCAVHFKRMYDAGNRLGLGLMTHTYMKETINALRKSAEALRAGAAGKSLIGRLTPGRNAISTQTASLRRLEESCVLCERLGQSMERYIYTLLYMYRREPEFPALFRASKGLCLEHYAQVLEAAPAQLSGTALKDFVDALTEIELKNFERLEGELEWFTKKFDWQNEDKPWGSSRDAVKRSINKLRRQIIEEQ